VGVAVSGVVDHASNEVVGAATLDIGSAGFAEKLEKLCNLPVTLERRPNAAALAEALFGAGKDYDSIVYLTSGRGVGAGIFINGEIYRGSSGTAGEIGLLHLPGGGRVEDFAVTARPERQPQCDRGDSRGCGRGRIGVIRPFAVPYV
jgi:glucokinase